MLTKAGSVLDVSITATALLNEEGKMHAISKTERDISTIKMAGSPKS
jgi:hypothetical protein